MSSIAPTVATRASLLERLLPDRLLAVLTTLMLVIAIIAVVRGHNDWAQVPRPVWLHLATIAIVLALTPMMLWRRKGDRRHRLLGWIWVTAMVATAVLSLAITPSGSRLISPISILSVFVLVAVPYLVMQARAHHVARHRTSVRGLVIGALLIAGFFTFPFNRLLGHWLFS